MKIFFSVACLLFSLSSFGQLFSEVENTSFEGVRSGSIAFTDIDGDNDQDIVITGTNSYGGPTMKVYLNDGNASFSELNDIAFDRVQLGTLSFLDIDGDQDEDVLITGINNSFSRIAKLYRNEGNASYVEVEGTPFTGVQDGSVAIADIDGDDDLDLLITGRNSPAIPSDPISQLYINDGNGAFTEIPNTPFIGVFRSSVAFVDVDRDNDPDLFITGEDDDDNSISKLYINEGAGIFVEDMNSSFMGVRSGAIAFADLDNDDDQDLFIGSGNVSKIYLNDGSGGFTEHMDNPIEVVNVGAVAIFDIEGDGDQDIMISGSPQTGKITKLYQNNGMGSFTEVEGTSFENVNFSSIAIGDIDGDDDHDVLLAGENESNQKVTKLYQNDFVSSDGDLSKTMNIRVFPNPASESRLYLDLTSNDDASYSYDILDSNGRLVLGNDVSPINGKFFIDISSLPTGIYVLTVQQDSHYSHQKFVVP